ncbi:dioxygenase family protein [Rhodovibrionaceae bacterium A322]
MTPAGPEGPFYPTRIPWDDDADLLFVTGQEGEAPGEVLYLEGRLLDANGRPLPSAQIEIWQCDVDGIYRHPGDPRYKQRDSRFQGFGHAMTDAMGLFAFRTIVPVPYGSRTPHIHVRVLIKGRLLLTTQLYRRGFDQNRSDFLFNRLEPGEQERVLMDIKELPGLARPSFETHVDLVVLDGY